MCFKPVAALCRLPAWFFDGLALLFDLFGLPVGFSLSKGGGCLLLGWWEFQQGSSVTSWRKPLLTLLILLFGWLGLHEWLWASCCLRLATALKTLLLLILLFPKRVVSDSELLAFGLLVAWLFVMCTGLRL